MDPLPTIPESLVTAVADRYRVEREIGAGGMATVYLAQDLRHDRAVAVKVLRPELAAVLGAERFLSEIRVTARLQHPNLLPLFDSGAAGGLLYYVMPFVDGATLRTKLEHERQLPADEAIRLATLIAGALDYAHGRGVIHRDLKPENILLQAGQPIIADFGIALAVAHAGGARITESGLSLGTPHYMSPEQAAGDPSVDARSDQYSLAAVTYEMLAGEPPHTGPTAQAIIARLMTETPRSLRAARPILAPALDHAVLRALSKPRADRFASCGEFAAALASAGVSASGETAAAPVARRRSRWAGRGLVAGALVMVAAWLATNRDGAAPPAPASGERSIAVLPLVNVGGDSTQEFFADGMSEELATALGRVPGLRVAARTSSYAFKGRRDLDVREVGDKLGVQAVLQGTVRRGGDRFRVSVQLTDTRTRLELWSDSYEQAVADAFAVQDSIVEATVAKLALSLGAGGLARRRGGRTVDPAAHDLYLQGRVVSNAETESSLRRALGYFRLALDRDPAYAEAHAGISTSYVAIADVFMPSAIAYDSARIAARKALALDSLSADAHASLGFAAMALDWDFALAERELGRAMELDPNSIWTLVTAAWYYCVTGRIDRGLAIAHRARMVDPLSPLAAWPTEVCLYSGREFEELRSRPNPADPGFAYWDVYPAAAMRETGRLAEALAEYQRAAARAENLPYFGLAVTHARMGRAREARAVLARIEARGAEHYVNPMSIAAIHAALGDRDAAFAAIERAIADRTVFLFGLVTWADFDPLRTDPRFAEVVRRIGLPASPAPRRAT